MGKQVLEKCLTEKPQSEQPMWTSLPKLSQCVNPTNCFPEKVTGKMNHPKTSANLIVGTNKNVAPDFRGRNLNRMDEHRKLWLRVGRTVIGSRISDKCSTKKDNNYDA